MSIPKEPLPAKLLIGVFLKDKSLLELILERIVKALGSVDMISPWLPFNFTSYYFPEMGEPLFRRIISFSRLIHQERLAEIKRFTNTIEQEFTIEGRRQLNIDPGYLLSERFVLASGKNFSHRIYIGLGIYADLTLIFQKGKFITLPWTYPDYADENMLHLLTRIRQKYRIDLKVAETL